MQRERVQLEEAKAKQNRFINVMEQAGVDLDSARERAKREQIQMDGQDRIDEGRS